METAGLSNDEDKVMMLVVNLRNREPAWGILKRHLIHKPPSSHGRFLISHDHRYRRRSAVCGDFNTSDVRVLIWKRRWIEDMDLIQICESVFVFFRPKKDADETFFRPQTWRLKSTNQIAGYRFSRQKRKMCRQSQSLFKLKGNEPICHSAGVPWRPPRAREGLWDAAS